MLEAGLKAKLADIAPLAGGRVYPVVRKQNEHRLSLTYQLISDPRSDDHDGARDEVEARYQITAWGAVFDDVKALAEEVKDGLHGFTGTIGTATVARVSCEGGSDEFNSGVGPQGSPGEHRSTKDYVFQYTE